MDLGKIEIGNIRVTKRDGNRLTLQCLKDDLTNLSKLPLSEIADGSTCLILNALDTENSIYVLNNGTWYGM